MAIGDWWVVTTGNQTVWSSASCQSWKNYSSFKKASQKVDRRRKSGRLKSPAFEGTWTCLCRELSGTVGILNSISWLYLVVLGDFSCQSLLARLLEPVQRSWNPGYLESWKCFSPRWVRFWLYLPDSTSYTFVCLEKTTWT